jgi:hypothetical protein
VSTAQPAPAAAPDPAAVMTHAADSEDPHAIKFADAALQSWSATRDPAVPAAAAENCTGPINRQA